MGESADQLREEVERAREGASDKIDQIEAKVQDTAQQVKEQFDFRRQVEERPLVALGAALIGGFILGGMTGDDGDGGERRVEGQHTPAYGSQSHRQSSGIMHGIKQAAKSSGFEETLTNMAAAFMGTATEKMKTAAEQNLPGFAQKFQSAQQAGGGFSTKAGAAQQSTSSPDRSSSVAGSSPSDAVHS
jgi:hypothetical protein